MKIKVYLGLLMSKLFLFHLSTLAAVSLKKLNQIWLRDFLRKINFEVLKFLNYFLRFLLFCERSVIEHLTSF